MTGGALKTFVLLYPPFSFKTPVILQPPLVIAHLYAVLEKAQVGNVEAVDLDVEFDHSARSIDYFLNRAVERVESLEPDVICLTCKSVQFPFVILFTRKYKSLHPETKIVIGGWVPTLTPDAVLVLSRCDAVVRGEGERVLPALLQRIDDEKWSIDGVSYKLQGEKPNILHNPNSTPLNQQELDGLPFPNYDCLPPLETYQPGFRNFYLTIEASRGCKNHNCIFCWNSTKYCDTDWRARSPERVVDEIQFLVKKYGANYFSFADDCFGADAQWLDRFISLMNERVNSEEVMYGCCMRVDYVNEELLEKLYRTGLRRVFHGIESGSPRMWKVLGKNLKLEVTQDYVVRMVRKEVEAGIDSQCSVIIGLPEETEEDIDETLSLCRRLADVGAHFSVHLLNPYEGTKLYALYSDMVKPFDIYNELGEYDNFDADFRKVFGGRLKELSNNLPDYRWVQPTVSPDQFRRKYFELRKITSSGLPFFYRSPRG